MCLSRVESDVLGIVNLNSKQVGRRKELKGNSFATQLHYILKGNIQDRCIVMQTNVFVNDRDPCRKRWNSRFEIEWGAKKTNKQFCVPEQSQLVQQCHPHPSVAVRFLMQLTEERSRLNHEDMK